MSEDVIYGMSLEVCAGEEALSEDALAALDEEAGGLGAAQGRHGQPEHALGQPREQQLGDRREGEDGLVLWGTLTYDVQLVHWLGRTKKGSPKKRT